jgi:hypothetical protein
LISGRSRWNGFDQKKIAPLWLGAFYELVFFPPALGHRGPAAAAGFKKSWHNLSEHIYIYMYAAVFARAGKSEN